MRLLLFLHVPPLEIECFSKKVKIMEKNYFYKCFTVFGAKPTLVCVAKIITIKSTKDLNYLSLCAFNLFNTQVSQFELNY